MSERFSEGDKVRFNARGRELVGTITRLRMRRRKGKARQLALLVTGDETSLDAPVAEIVPEGGGAVWTVPTGSIVRIAAAAPAKQREAYETVHAIKRAKRDRADRRGSANYDSLQASGLMELAGQRDGGKGSPIEIKFSDIGWAAATFEGLVAGSMNVRYRRHGRVRSTAAENARIPAPPKS